MRAMICVMLLDCWGVCRSTLHTYIKCGDLAVGVHHYTGKKFVLGASILNFWRGEPMRKNRGK